MYYLHVQDFVDAYIGPFDTEKAADEHYTWCQTERHDSAVKIGISTNLPPKYKFALVLTPEEDKNWKES